MGTQPQKSSRKPPVSPDPNILYNFTDQESALELQAQQQAQIAIDQSQFPGLQINGVLGGLPVAEKNQEYFAVVFEAADTTPEIIDQTQFKVIYLCDSKLNVSKPSQDSVALNNIIQNFERQKRARVRVDQGTVLNNQLAGLHQITAVGSIEPICGTQIGSGPLSYVTTMSFYQEDQLGPDLSRPIAGYYQWLNKTSGYNNTKISYKTSGTTNQGDAWSYSEVEEGKLQTYYDGIQADPSGAAVEAGDSQSLYDENYFDVIDILTGSIEGNSRVKVKIGAMVNVVTSSVADIVTGVLQRLQGFIDGGSALDFDQISNALVTLNVYREPESGYADRILLGSTTVAIPTINQSLAFYQDGTINGYSAGSEILTLMAFSIFNKGPNDGTYNVEDDVEGFSWNVNGSARALVVETDYFEVSENDKVYGELVFPEEEESPTIGALGLNMDNVIFSGEVIETSAGPLIMNVSFTESLYEWKNTAALRQYSYFVGSSVMTQETPEAGPGFANNITGITASYNNYTNDIPTASVYNYTGSYWLNFNNFSSSDEGVGAWITSSTALANFYGGDYIQVNPGTETYNILNADSSPTSSLFANGLDEQDKLTWNNFGFSPIKLSFAPRAGDFIRFEFSKQKVFLITAVNSSGNVLKLKLDKQMETSTVLDNFVIYRIVEDGQYLILNVKKNNEAGVTQPFSGIISAEFPSEALDERTDQLLFDLKQAGIISERDYLK